MNPRITSLEILLEVLVGLLVAFCWIWVNINYSGLPDKYPVHFTDTGMPESFGSKSIIVILPTLSTGLFILLIALNRFSVKIKKPSRISLKKVQTRYYSSIRIVSFYLLIVVLVFLFFTLLMIESARGEIRGIDSSLISVVETLFIIPLILVLNNTFHAVNHPANSH